MTPGDIPPDNQEPSPEDTPGPTSATVEGELGDAAEAVRDLLAGRPMLFIGAYMGLLLFSAMDVVLTWVILSLPDGQEVNALARLVIERFGWGGAIVYKFLLVTIFILVCEVVGRIQFGLARGECFPVWVLRSGSSRWSGPFGCWRGITRFSV